MKPILIERIPGAFRAIDPVTRKSGYGNTWMEALGALVATDSAVYEIGDIKYNLADNATRNFVIERSLDERVN